MSGAVDLGVTLVTLLTPICGLTFLAEVVFPRQMRALVEWIK